MVKNDLVLAHLRDTTSTVRVTKKATKIRRAIWVLGAVALGLLLSAAQMRQRDKADAYAAKEGKIPTITISSK